MTFIVNVVLSMLSFFFQFLFIEGADIPHLGDKPYKLKETLRTVSPSGGVVTTTKTVFSKPGVAGEFVFDVKSILQC